MKILAFDVSSMSTGYSVINNGRLLKGSLGMIQPNPRRQYGERLQVFESELKKIIQKHNPDIIVVEDIFKGRNIKTFRSLAMFRGVAIKAIYDETMKDPVIIMASEARSLVGSENKKEKAFEFITSKFKLDLDFDTQNDIADSIVLALAGHIMDKKGIDAKSIQNTRRKKKRKRKRNKKSV